jgi:hypothetical protein
MIIHWIMVFSPKSSDKAICPMSRVSFVPVGPGTSAAGSNLVVEVAFHIYVAGNSRDTHTSWSFDI